MAQAANVAVGLTLESASFETSAQRARRVFNESLGNIQRDAQRSADALGSLTRAAQGLAALAGFTIAGRGALDLARSIVSAGDAATQLRAKLEASVGNGGAAFNEAKAAADKLGVSTDAVAGTVAKLGFALQGTGTSRQTLLQITETMARLGAIGGASTQQITDGLQQLSQGLAKGRLDGDELRSVLENIPGSGRLIADAMGVAQGSLRDLGAEGKITHDVVIRAFTEGADAIKEQFDSLPPSLGRATATMQNQFAAMFAAIDAKLGSSEFVKYLSGNLGDIASSVTARLSVASPVVRQATPDQAAFAKNRDSIEQLTRGRANALSSGIDVADYDRALADLVERQQQLQSAIEGATDAQQRQNRALQNAQEQAARFANPSGMPAAVPTPGNISPQSIYPTSTLADQKALKGYLDDAAQARREAQTKAEQAAKTAATEAREAQALIDTIGRQAEASKRLADATAISSDAVARARIENEHANRMAEASVKLKGAELEAYRKSAEAIRDNALEVQRLNEVKPRGVNAGMWETSGGSFRSAERQSMEDYEKYARDQTNGIDKERDQQARAYADLQRDILIRPWQDMASEVTSITNRMFDDLLTNGKASIGDIAKGFGDVVKQTITGTASNLIMMPVNTAISEVARQSLNSEQGLGGALQDFYTKNPNLAAGAMGATGGYVTGSIYGQLTGKQDTYAATGGAVGGAAGAVLGNILLPGAGGVIGGVLGSVGGSFLGGLFGGGKMGNDQSRQDYWTTKGKITWSDSSFSPENRAITSGLGGQLAALQESLGGLGATFADVGIKLGAGNKSGITVNGKQYGSQEEALPAALRLLLNSAGGLSGSQQTAIQNTKGRNVQEVLGDVAFAKEFDKLTFTGTAAEAAMRDLNERFDETARRAHDLGLNEQALADARAKAVERLQTEKARQDRDLDVSVLNAIEGSGLQSAIRTLDNGFAQLVDRMTDAGYSTESLAAAEAARVRAIEETIRAQQKQIAANDNAITGQVRGAGSYFDNLIDPLKAIANDNGALTPLAKVQRALAKFREDLSGAQSGDTRSLQSLTSSSAALKGLVDQNLGTGGYGQAIRREIEQGVGSVAADLERQRNDLLATLPQVQRETTADVIKAFRDGIAELLASNDNLLTELRRQSGRYP